MHQAVDNFHIEVLSSMLESGSLLRNLARLFRENHSVTTQINKLKLLRLILENGVNISEIIPFLNLSSDIEPPSSYEELMLLLRRGDFNIFPLSGDEEFISLINNHGAEGFDALSHYNALHLAEYLHIENYHLLDVTADAYPFFRAVAEQAQAANYNHLISLLYHYGIVYSFNPEEINHQLTVDLQGNDPANSRVLRAIAKFLNINIHIHNFIDNEALVILSPRESALDIHLAVTTMNFFSINPPLRIEVAISAPVEAVHAVAASIHPSNTTNHDYITDADIARLLGEFNSDHGSGEFAISR